MKHERDVVKREKGGISPLYLPPYKKTVQDGHFIWSG